MRWFRRALLGLGALLVVAAVVSVGLVVWLRTASGAAWLVATVNRAVSTPDRRITLSGLTGGLPFDWHLAGIEIADRNGPWLRLTDVALEIDGAALVHGIAHITNLSAVRLDVLRAPTPAPAAAPAKGSGGFSLPSLPVSIVLDRLDLARISADPSVLGSPLVARLSGNGGLVGTGVKLVLALDRLDQPGSLTIDAGYEPGADGGQLRVTAKADEPSGVVLAQILPNHEQRPFSLSLSGAGPLNHWSGTLGANAGADADLAATMTIVRHATDLSILLNGTSHDGPFLSDPLRASLGTEVRFDVAASVADAGPIGLDRLTITAAGGTVSGKGRFVPADGSLAGTLDATTDLEHWRGFGPPDLAGALALHADASGTVAAPVLAVTVHGDHLVTNGDSIADATARIDAVTEPDALIHVTGTGRLAGILASGLAPAMPAGDDLDFAIDGTARRDASQATLTKLTLSGGGLQLSATGGLSGGTITGRAQLAADDIARLASLAGLHAAGSVQLVADAHGASAGALQASVSGALHRFRSGIPTVDAVLGPEVAIDAAGGRPSAGRFDLGRLSVTGGNLTLTGTGHYDQNDGEIGFHGAAALADLAPVGRAVGTPMAGSLTLTADSTGTMSAPGGTMVLDGRKIALAQIHGDHLAATVASADFAKRIATLSTRLTSGTETASLSARISQPSASRIAVDDLQLSGPKTDLKGAVTYDLDDHIATGALMGQSTDLAAWQAFVDEPMGGHVMVSLTLARRNGQGIDAAVTGGDLLYGTGSSVTSARKFSVRANLVARQSEVRGSADADLAGLKSGAVAIDAADLHARSDEPGVFALSTTSSGEANGRKFAVNARGVATTDAGGQSLTLPMLEATYGTLKARLSRTLSLQRRGTAIRMHDLALALNDGTVTGDLALDSRQLSATLRGDNLPVGTLGSLADRGDLGGRASFAFSLDGPLSAPHGQATVTLTTLRLGVPEGGDKTRDQGDAVPIDVALSATLAGPALRMQGRIKGTDNEASLDLGAQVPVAFSPAGIPSVPPDGAISARVQGSGTLETLTKLMPIGEDRATGAYAIDLSVAGTVGNPQASGGLTLTKASYDNEASGMTLRNLTIDVGGAGRQFTVRTLTAGDGAQGTVTGSGGVDLGAAGGPSFDFSATLSDFRVSRRDDASVWLSGTTKVGGTLTAPAVTAALTIDRAEINLPQRLPAATPTLSVLRIDSTTPDAVRVARLKAARARQAASPVIATFDVKLHDGGQTFIRGDGLDSEWKGDFTIAGTSAAPTITGELDAINGTLSLLGKDFVIQKGRVTFTGPPIPDFDIDTQVVAGDITAQAELAGTPDQPKLTLTSTPALPQDEVLSHIMFGSGVGSITPAEGLQVAAAAASLVGGGGPGVLDRLRNATGLDRLAVGQDTSTGSSGSTGALGGTTVSGGKYVAPGVFVGVDQGVSGGSTRARVEISVVPHVTVNAIAGASSSSGSSLGAQYSRDY